MLTVQQNTQVRLKNACDETSEHILVFLWTRAQTKAGGKLAIRALNTNRQQCITRAFPNAVAVKRERKESSATFELGSL